MSTHMNNKSPPATAAANAPSTDDQALSWFLKLKDPSASGEERRAFAHWHAASPANAHAFAHIEATWQAVEAPAQLLALRDAPAARAPRRQNARAPRWGWAVAALCLLVMLLGVETWREPAHLDRLMADTVTSPGAPQTLTLDDGSTLLLDGNSAISVDFSEGERALSLRRGRLWVDVTRDIERPFVISAGDASIRVLGTHFAVTHAHNRVIVTVGEGRVAVNDGFARQVTLTDHQQVILHEGRLGPVQPVDTQLALAWRENRLLFANARIDDVIDELERMLPGRVLHDTSALSGVRVSGSFPRNDPDVLLDALAATFGVDVRRLPGQLVWLGANEPRLAQSAHHVTTTSYNALTYSQGHHHEHTA